MFGCGISNGTGRADFAGHRSHINNLPASPFQHMRDYGLCTPDRAHVVHVHHVIELPGLHVGKSGKLSISGVIQ
ncbi:hypothetical protein D3C84_1241840 [compost metagenome]